MEDPSKVRDATSQYRENNDIFLQFMNECYVRDNRANVKLNDVYENFKSWAKMSLTGKETLPTKRAMQDYMVKKWGPLLPGQKWIGYRERTIEDDEAEGKLLVLRKEDLKDDDEKHSSSQLVDDDDDF
jgi:phage/plasmid-associated DNA primase